MSPQFWRIRFVFKGVHIFSLTYSGSPLEKVMEFNDFWSVGGLIKFDLKCLHSFEGLDLSTQRISLQRRPNVFSYIFRLSSWNCFWILLVCLRFDKISLFPQFWRIRFEHTAHSTFKGVQMFSLTYSTSPLERWDDALAQNPHSLIFQSY